jgi:hypothetical protein
MYFPTYDPTYHDVYLYGDGNTGFPIALNPNCLLYGASGSYRAIGLRYRDWDIQVSAIPIPPSAGITSYPNYYNNNYPIYYKINDKTLGCSIHFTWYFEFERGGNPDLLFPQILPPIPPIGTTVTKVTESLTGYTGIGFARYYNNNFSSFDDYYDFEHSFNYLNTWPGGLTLQEYVEIRGNTYFAIAQNDHGLINKINSSGANGITGPYLQVMHPLSILDKETIKNILNYTSSSYGYYTSPITITVPVNDVYIWGGNDTIAPAESMSFSIASLKTTTDVNLQSSVNIGWPLITAIEFKVADSEFWQGDSSGLALYLKDGKLYGLMTAYSTGTNSLNGPILCGGQLPNFYYMTQTRGVCSNYFFSNNDSIKVATTNYFTKLIDELNNSKNILNNKVQETL